MKRLWLFCLLTSFALSSFAQVNTYPNNPQNVTVVINPKDTLFQKLLFQEDLFLNEFTFRPKRGLGVQALPQGGAFVFFEYLQEEKYQLILMQVDEALGTKHIQRIDLAQGHRVADVFWVEGQGLYLIGERYGEKGQQIWTALYNEDFELQKEHYLFPPDPNRFLEEGLVTQDGALFMLVGNRLDSLELWSQLSWDASLNQTKLQGNRLPLGIWPDGGKGIYLHLKEESANTLPLLQHFSAKGQTDWTLPLTAHFETKHRGKRLQTVEGRAKLLTVQGNAQGESFALVENVTGDLKLLKIAANGQRLGEQKTIKDEDVAQSAQLLLLDSDYLLVLTGFYYSSIQAALHHQQQPSPYYNASDNELQKDERIDWRAEQRSLFIKSGYYNTHLHDAASLKDGSVLLLYDDLDTKDLRLMHFGPESEETFFESLR